MAIAFMMLPVRGDTTICTAPFKARAALRVRAGLMARPMMVMRAIQRGFRPSEQPPSLFRIQHTLHLLAGNEGIGRSGNGMGAHDRGHHVPAHSDRHIDGVSLHYGRPVLVAQRMSQTHGRGKCLASRKPAQAAHVYRHHRAEAHTAHHRTAPCLVPQEDIAIPEGMASLQRDGQRPALSRLPAQTILLGVPLGKLQHVHV